MTTSTLIETQILEAYADALKALVTALGWQIDPVRLHRIFKRSRASQEGTASERRQGL